LINLLASGLKHGVFPIQNVNWQIIAGHLFYFILFYFTVLYVSRERRRLKAMYSNA
jgi:hypothetical protein